MKHTSLALLAVVAITLTGCRSYSWDAGDDARYRAWSGRLGYISQRLWLYEAGAHQYTYRKMVLLDRPLINRTGLPDPDLRFVTELSLGTPIQVEGFKRERGGDGHVWDYMLGTVTPSMATGFRLSIILDFSMNHDRSR